MTTATLSAPSARHRAVASHLRRDAIIVGILVLAVVAVVTVGKPFIEIPGVVDASAHRVRSLNLELFSEWNGSKVWYGPYTNTFGNIALFLPVGAVLMVLGQRAKKWRFGLGGTILLGLALSLGIEVTQYAFALGYSDVDDVLCNTVGGALGGIALSRLSHDKQAKVLHRAGFIAAALLTILVCGLLTGFIT